MSEPMSTEREGLAALLAQHFPIPVFGCECTPVDDESGVKEILDEPWEHHLADVLAARDRRVRAEAWDEGYERAGYDMGPYQYRETPNPYRDDEIEADA